MSISVKFFARLREAVGRDSQVIAAAQARTAHEAWRIAAAGVEMPAGTLIAINQEYARLDQPLHDGDEVAFFPPVTGG